jgi:hypothetical protein
MLCNTTEQGHLQQLQAQRANDGAYHIEGNHIAKGDVTGLVSLDQVLIYQDGAAAGGET